MGFRFDAWLRDIAFGVRLLTKNWMVGTVIVASIAVGVSASATAYCWIQSILIHPLPAVPAAGQLAVLATKAQSGELLSTSYADFQDWREQARSFTDIAAFTGTALSLQRNGQNQRIWAGLVSGEFFNVLQLQPAHGRFFLPEDHVDATGGAPVAVISYDFWNSTYNADPAAVGSVILLNRQSYTIIAVAPRDFRGTVVGLSFDVWVPLLQQHRLTGADDDWVTNREYRSLQAMARLSPGATIAGSQAELDVIAKRLAEKFPDQNTGIGFAAFSLSRSPFGAQRVLGQMLDLLLIASLLVLAVVCINLASLLFAQVAAREKEISVRMALGADRWRVVRQLLVEGVVLSLAAAAVSVVLVYWWSGLLRYFAPPSNLPVALLPAVDATVLWGTLALAILAGLCSGLIPALRGTSINLIEALKEDARGTSSGRRKQRVRTGLVICEIALAFVALIGAALLVRSFQQIERVNPGFDADHTLLFALAAAQPDIGAEEMLGFYGRAAERVRAVRGVRAVGFAESVPLGFTGGSWEDLGVEGYAPRQDENMKIYRNLVSEDYFDVMKIPVIAGRSFTVGDDGSVAPVAIVNAAFAKRFFGGGETIGRRLSGWGETLTIVGVAADSKYASLTEDPQPYLYVPFRQFAGPDTESVLHVAVDGAPADSLAEVRGVLETMTGSGYVVWGMPLKEYSGASTFKSRLAAILLSVLGLTALLLAALGIYSITSDSVRQRINEIAVRMAVGASAARILKLFIGQVALMAAIGIAAGVAISLALSRPFASLVFGVSVADPLVYASVAAILTCVAVCGSAIPAWRAAKIDPAVALRMG